MEEKRNNRPHVIDLSYMSDEERRGHEALKAERLKSKGVLFVNVSDILFRYDPAGINFDDNIDEYDPEAEMVVKEQELCSSVDEFQKKIHEIFIQMFDRDIAGNIEFYEPIAKEIWDLKSNV